MLARKSIGILVKIGSKPFMYLSNEIFLERILQISGNNHYNERKELLDSWLANHIIFEGADCKNVSMMSFRAAGLHFEIANNFPRGSSKRTKQVNLSEKYCREALRIARKVYGAEDPGTVYYKSFLLRLASLH